MKAFVLNKRQHRHYFFSLIISLFLLLICSWLPTAWAADPLDTWYQRADRSAYGLGYGNGVFVAVGDAGAIATSADGLSWVSAASSNTNILYAVAPGQGTFVAVGAAGAILTSADNGASWTVRTSGLSANLRSIAFGNGMFVAVGEGGAIATSGDGITWTAASVPVANSLYGVAFGSGTFAAVGATGTILTSSDNGATWTDRSGVLSSNLWEIAYGNGIFAALGDAGSMLTSADGGESWAIQSPGTAGDLYGIGFGNGLFIAVGADWNANANIIIASSGGVVWTPHPAALTLEPPLVAVVYGNSTFVASSAGGVIIQSDPLSLLHTLTVDRTGPGAVTSKPVGIDCGSTCLASFPDGTTVTLTAAPLTGASFNGWTGGGCSGSQAACTFTLNAAQTVTALFSPNSLPTGSVLINGGAAATSSLLVDLVLSAADPTMVTEMQFSNDNVEWSLPEPFGGGKLWALLEGDGIKTVYVKFRNGLGYWSEAFTAQIVLDTVPPVTTAQPAGGAFPDPPVVTLSADEAATIYYALDNAALIFESGTYQAPLLITEDMTLTYFAVDGAGNVSAYEAQVYRVANPLKGDINFDRKVDLADAILYLKAFNGENPSEVRFDYAQSKTDPNNDGKVNPQDVIFIMQRISGLR